MNKLFTKIVGAALGLTMAIGVGVAVASSREAIPVEAATNTVTFSGADFANSSSWTYSGSTSGYDSSKGVTIYKADNGGVLTSPSFTNVTGVSVVYSSSSKGVASFSTKVGSGTAQSSGNISKNQINTTMNLYSSSGESGALTITITCTTSTLYVKSFTVTTTGGTGYTVSFNANGGTGNMESETGISGSYTLPACGFTAPSNKDFAGWKPENTGDTVYAAGASYTISAATEFYAQWVDHQINRKYTVTSTSAVSESGDTMTGTSSTFSNTYSTKDQISAGNSMTLTITGMTKKVNINKLVFSMHSNSSNGSGYVTIAIDGGTAVYLSGNSSGVEFTSFGDDGTTYGTDYRDIIWDDLDYTASSSIVIVIASTYKSIYCQWFDIFFEEQVNNDVVTALSVSPNSWTGYDSGTVNVASYTVSVTKNGAAGTSADYEFQGIGYGSGDGFTARVADFTSGHPTTSDTRLQWKAKYPTQAGGSTYLYTYVSLSVTADSISTISVSGTMPSDYSLGGSWSTTGLTVTAHYLSTNTDTLTSDLSWNFYSDENMTNEIATPDDLGIGNSQTIYVKATYSGVTPSKVSAAYAQVVNVSKEPGVINFGSASGSIAIDSASVEGEDTLGNSVSVTCSTSGNTPYYNNTSTYAQYGSGNNPMTTLVVTVSFGEGEANRKSIENFEIKLAGSANAASGSYQAYTDGSTSNTVLSGSYSGSSDSTQSTPNNFTPINGNSLTVAFSGSGAGVKLYYITYQLGDKVQEFGTLSSIAINPSSTHSTQFKVDEEFTSAGLIITATDTVGFTKDFTSEFTTDFDGYTFEESDVGEGISNTVSLTIKGVTKTTSYTFDVINPPTYSLVSSQGELYEGMKVIIYGSNNKALGSETTGYFNEASVTFDDAIIDDGSAATEFTVRIYGSDGFALQHGSKYLQYTGSGNNAYLSPTLDSSAVWTYGDAGLVNVGTNTRELRHNSGATRFACYLNNGQSITGARVSLYVSSATPKTDLMGAETFAQRYLHMRDYASESGYCSDNTHHYYLTAKAAYNDLSAGEKTEFASLATAKARYEAWATANHDGAPYDGNDDIQTLLSARVLPNIIGDGSNTVAIIVIVSMISVTAIGGYFFIRKRKEQ